MVLEDEGEKILEKYVQKTVPKTKEAAHVGGPLPKNQEEIGMESRSLNKLGMERGY